MTRTIRGPRLAAVVGVVGFWTCASLGAAQQPGYDRAQDYLSSLAAVGADQPGWGLLMFAFAVLVVVAGAWRVRSGTLLASAAALAVAAVARVDCPAGAAQCSAGALVVEPDALGRVHAASVVAYQVLFTAALLHLAWVARRCGQSHAAAAALLGAVVPFALAFDPLPLAPGLSQRLWVVAGQVVLVAVAFWPPRPDSVAP